MSAIGAGFCNSVATEDTQRTATRLTSTVLSALEKSKKKATLSIVSSHTFSKNNSVRGVSETEKLNNKSLKGLDYRCDTRFLTANSIW